MPLHPQQSRSPDLRIFTSASLLVVDYMAAGTLASLDENARHQQALLAAYPKISSLQIMSGPVGKVDDALKKKAAEMTKAIENKCFGSAIVIPGSSLGAMMIRTVVTGINMVSKSNTPQKCFATIGEALSWLQSFPGQDPQVMKLTAGEIEALFPALGKKAA